MNEYGVNKRDRNFWIGVGVSIALLGSVVYFQRLHKTKKNENDDVQADDQVEPSKQTNGTRNDQIADNEIAGIVEQNIAKDNNLLEMFNSEIKKNQNPSLLIIGDSQVKRNMGSSFQSILDTGNNNLVDYWGVEGTEPNKILRDHINKATNQGNLLIAKLSKTPPLIVIQLGDNGIGKSETCHNLILYIHSFYKDKPKPTIIWSGPFPLCLPVGKKTSTYFLAEPCDKNNSYCFPTYQARKKGTMSTKIRDGIKGLEKTYFVSPFDSPPFNLKNTPCFTDDGIHITKNAMDQYVNYLLGMELQK